MSTSLKRRREANIVVAMKHFPTSAVGAVFLFFLVTATLPAQITGLGDFYRLDDFSSTGAVRDARNYVTLQGSYRGKYLVVEATVLEGWHLYSVTQPEGGTIRSEFALELPEAEWLEIRPTVAPYIEDRVVGFNVDIESHGGVVVWVLTFREDLPKGGPIKGRLEGQVCQSGEGGLCIPVNVPFEANFDPELDVESYFAATQGLLDRFIRRSGAPSAATPETFTPQEMTPVSNFGMLLFYAFLGGIILNVMPCVLPVIGLKILSFFEQAGKSRARAFYLNVWYALGLLSVFLVLAYLTVGLSRMFTYDLFCIVMACVVFAMALSLMGVWEISVPAQLGRGTAVKWTQQEGAAGAFFKGIITTLLAIPCGAPLLSPAVNWADMQIRAGNTPLVFVVYGMIGLGMASPYLVIGAFPELLRFLPKPGDWMETFKKTMGFFLLVAVLWILYFVRSELVLPIVALLFAVWFACWAVGRLDYAASPRTRIVSWTVGLLVLATTVWFSFDIPRFGNPYTLEAAMKTRIHGHEGKHWRPYTPKEFDRALRSGKPVLVDFTADWCVNCKVLEETVLRSENVLRALDRIDAVTLVADCTRAGVGKDFLLKFGADQVPVLALFDPKEPSRPIVLRGGYTQRTLLELLEKLE